MYDPPFDTIKLRVCTKLKGLAPNLAYHSIGHTLDVLAQSERIALEEGLTDERKLHVLKVAALYHDTGFLRAYRGHEPESCAIFLADAPQLGLSEEEQQEVLGLIMATRIPQTPTTPAQRIICDADLDYLGRPDFFEISEKLRAEFLAYGIVANDEEWEAVQLRFLQAHTYFTASSRRLRGPVAQKNLAASLKA